MTINHDQTILEEMAALKLEALEKTGFDDFGDSFFEEPLAAWINDLNHAYPDVAHSSVGFYFPTLRIFSRPFV